MTGAARTTGVLVGFACLGVALFVANMCLGSVAVPLDEVARIVFGGSDPGVHESVVWQIRLPRTIACTVLGASLAVSGYLLQTYFDNPIASPYILGVSSGARFAVALAMIVVVGAGGALATWQLVGSAFVGALVVMAVVAAISRRIRSSATLIVAGVMVGYICSAATDFLVTFADDQNIVNLHLWGLGSFAATNWDDVASMTPVAALALVGAFALAKPIGAYRLGESQARGVGVNVRALRVALVGVASLLAATVTAFAGPVSFVGVAVPHIVRTALSSTSPGRCLAGCMLAGAAFCLLCDLVARTAFAPTELTLSAVTALFGAPVVIAMLMGKKGRI